VNLQQLLHAHCSALLSPVSGTGYDVREFRAPSAVVSG
jgi:hypothetical protein